MTLFPIIHHPSPIIVNYKQESFNQFQVKGDIKLLKSHKLWSNFEEISNIYRESGHNKEISDYLKNKFQKAGFKVEQKADGTICAQRKLNKEKNNAIILQAHMDMVGISADGNSKKPIKLTEKDGWLYANDRTLGADNGIGIAAMLAIAEDPQFKDCPLEMIATTDEETNMIGAAALLEKDFYGKYLINLDTEEEGIIIKGCAGIAKFEINEKIKMSECNSHDYSKISIKITGCNGGHSAEIKEDSLNPIKILLSEIATNNLSLISFSGGERPNAIPRDANAEILVPVSKEKEVLKKIEGELEIIKAFNITKNPNFKYNINSVNAAIGTAYIETEFQKKLLSNLNDIPTGLLSKFEDNGLTKTSQNFGILNIQDGTISAQIMGRSSDKKEGRELAKKTSQILSNIFDKQIEPVDRTPIWQPKETSVLEETAVKAYCIISQEIKPIVRVEHGGLEPAIFTQKVPCIEQISIGPTIEDPHSIQERVKIDTVVPFYKWLCKILELLSKH